MGHTYFYLVTGLTAGRFALIWVNQAVCFIYLYDITIP